MDMATLRGKIFNIQKYSVHDGPGIRTIVFLKGCLLRCKWCSNPESLSGDIQVMFNRNLCIDCGTCLKICKQKAIHKDPQFGKIINYKKCNNCGDCIVNCPKGALKIIGRYVDIEEVLKEVKKDLVFYRKSGGGVTLSGGEPFAQPLFAAGLLHAFKTNRISTAVETAGYVAFESYERCLDDIDLLLYDIKHMDSKTHKRYTGVSNTLIQKNLEKLNSRGKKIWIRVPLISGVNDSFENIREVYRLAESLENVARVELLPYHSYGAGKYAQLGMDYTLEKMDSPSDAHIDDLLKMADEEFRTTMVVVRKHE